MHLFPLTSHLSVVIALIISASTVACSDSIAEDPPNIILIVADDLGWKDVGFMGSTYYETPNLDQLSTESIVFRQAYAGAANCAPSRACLLSGQNTPRHEIYTVGNAARGHEKTRKLIPVVNNTTLADSVLTLAEVLQNNGYTTSTMGKWHLGEDPRTQGFDSNIGGTHAGHPKSYFSPYKNPALPDGPEGEYLTDRLSAEAVHFIRQQSEQEQPFFLYLPYFSIHTPLQAKPGRINKYEAKPMSGGQGRNPTYAAMIETLDEGIGYILRTLENLDLQENTIVLFTSDNGAIANLSLQRPWRAGKGSYYEGGIRVPLLMHWPKEFPAARTSEAVVTNLDIFPTILDLANIEKPGAKVFDGISIKNHLLNNEAIPDRVHFWHFPIYLQAYNPGHDESRDSLFRTRPGTVMRQGDWKLHEYFEDGAFELYNLASDPGERKDLSAAEPAKLAEMQAAMRAWREEMKAPIPTEMNPTYDAAFRPKIKRR